MLHRNLGLKLIAFALAVALWGWVLVNQSAVASARTVPVVPNIVGSPPPGILITSVQVNPPVVTIAGAAEDVSGTKYVNTAELPIDRLTTDTTQQLALVIPKSIRLLGEDTEVKVTVRVTRQPPLGQESAPESP